MSETEAPENIDPYKIEPARSSRSKCKTCKRPIEKGSLRLGILIEGPFGTGFLWHHLPCAAKRQWESLEEAYEGKHWEAGVEPPALASLQDLREKAEEKKKNKKTPPYVEIAPTGRSKCRHCEELIEKGDLRVILTRDVEFYNQTRSGPINLHPKCVAAELLAEDCGTEIDGFADAMRSNSVGVESKTLDEALLAIGELPG